MSIIKVLFSTLFILFFILNGFSQNPQSQGSMTGIKMDSTQMNNMPKIGKVFGKVIDEQTNKAVEYAAVAVLRARDSSVAGGALTDGKGNFKIEELPVGMFKLRITFIGYLTFESEPFKLNPSASEKDFGIIKLPENTKILKQANVVAEKSELNQSIDKKTYNVEKNIVNTGGTVIDVLQQIPGVNTDMDGKILFRGSNNVTILIDGKPSAILGNDKNEALKQIPANAIEAIEVIANPSAKYDAEGMAGIINIKTKKEKMKGLNANVSVGVGTNDKYNAAINLNYRTSKYNLYGNYNFRSENRDGSGAGTQEYYLPNTAEYSYQTGSNSLNKSMFNSGKVGLDLYLNNYNTLGFYGAVNSRIEDKNETVDYTFLDSIQVETDNYYKQNNSDENNFGYEGNVDYKHTFKNSKKELTATVNYSTNIRTTDNYFIQSNYSIGETPYDKNHVNTPQQNFLAQTDYVYPINEKSKLETGAKATLRKFDNDVTAVSYSNGEYYNDPQYTDHFIYSDQVYAAYGLYSMKLSKKFDFNGGLRLEATSTNGDSKTTDSVFKDNYINLFPTAAIKYGLNSKTDLQLSYSRRINRPDLRSLNPFVDYADSLNLRMGNPYLNPELIHSIDLSYMRNTEKTNISVSVYYRHTDDLISRYRTVDSITGVATMKPTNFNSSDNLGSDASIRYQIGKIGNVMLSASCYYNKINGSNVQSDLQSEAFNWNSRLAFAIRALKNTNIQITGFYAGPMKFPNSTIKGMMNGVDVGIKQDLWGGKGSISFNVTDIFNTRKFSIYNYGDYYEFNGYRKRESRVAMLTFAYRFGSQDNNMFKNKKGNRQDMQQPDQQIDF